MKISELKRTRAVRIECSCGDLWIAYGNLALSNIIFSSPLIDRKMRREFIEKHADHDVRRLIVRSKVTKQ